MEVLIDQVLTLTREPALLARGGKILYANAAAEELLGAGCAGRSVKQLFGEDVAGMQGHSFLAQISADCGPCLLRVADTAEGRLFFVSARSERPAILNEPFLYALRAALMSIGMSSTHLRERAEERQDAEALEALRSLTAGYYRILRMSANASLVLADAQGGVAFSPAQTDLSALCRSVAEGAAHFFPAVRFQVEAGEHITAPADPALIRQMLLNLLSNCLVHAAPCGCIRLRLTEAAAGPVFSVSDDGRGIEPQQLHTVFDRYRHGYSLPGLAVGPGLGLTACRAVTALHGGTLLLESRPGQGTEVRASLSRLAVKALMHAAAGEVDCSAAELITGLADCLPPEAFDARYLD